MGEMLPLPLVPVVLAVIHDATGLWLDEIPVTPDRLWRALHQQMNENL